MNRNQYLDEMLTREQYAIIPNELWTVEGLDDRAKLLWCYLMAQSSSRRFSRNQICRSLRFGRDQISALIKALCEKNMLQFAKGASGKWEFEFIVPSQWKADSHRSGLPQVRTPTGPVADLYRSGSPPADSHRSGSGPVQVRWTENNPGEEPVKNDINANLIDALSDENEKIDNKKVGRKTGSDFSSEPKTESQPQDWEYADSLAKGLVGDIAEALQSGPINFESIRRQAHDVGYYARPDFDSSSILTRISKLAGTAKQARSLEKAFSTGFERGRAQKEKDQAASSIIALKPVVISKPQVSSKEDFDMMELADSFPDRTFTDPRDFTGSKGQE